MKRMAFASALALLIACGSRPTPAPPVPPAMPTAAVRVTVKDRAGKPIANASIDISAIAGEDDGRTDAAGYWAEPFPLLTPPETYRLEVRADGYVARGIDVALYAGDVDVVLELQPLAPPIIARRGVVNLCGRAFCDGGGAWNALGASLFHALSSYRQHRAALDADLEWISRTLGADYIRVLGVVGGDRVPDPWEFAGAFLHWDDYWKVVEAFTDYAYDKYGLRVQFTIFGGRAQAPDLAAQLTVIDRYADIINARPHKVQLVEIANEAFQNGWGGDEAGLRALARRLRDRLAHPIPIALSTPAGIGDNFTEEQANDEIGRLYGGDSGANIWTPHWSREVNLIDGPWRHVRKPWEARQFADVPAASVNNEPLGPGSSVASEEDPVRLAGAAVSSWSTGQAGYVLHSNPGVWGGRVHLEYRSERFQLSHVFDYPSAPQVASALKAARDALPADVQNWTHVRHGQNGHPFFPSFGCSTTCAQIWPDGHAAGVVRIYAAVNGDEFVVHPIGIKGEVRLTAARAMTFQLLDPLTFTRMADVALAAGQTYTLSEPRGAVLIRGSYRRETTDAELEITNAHR